MIKDLLRDEYKKVCYINSENFQMLKKTSENHRYIMLDTPEHGNLGDQAILLAEKQFLQNECQNKICIEITHKCYSYIKRSIEKNIYFDDILLIHGGGFIGTLWPDEEEILIDILSRFKNNKIIIFPQTVFFDNTKKAQMEKKRLKTIIENCTNLTVFLRDKRSYDSMQDLLGNDIIAYVPDIVTYLKVPLKENERSGVLLCMRNDGEKTISDTFFTKMAKILINQNLELKYTDTVLKNKIDFFKREETVYNKIEEFSQAKLVITDRLHGMIFSAISSTPCIAFDNISKKVSGGYEWLSFLPYIKCIMPEDFKETLVKQLLSLETCQYDSKVFGNYYDKIKNTLLK